MSVSVCESSAYEYHLPGEQFKKRSRMYALSYPNVPYMSASPLVRLSELRHKFKAVELNYIDTPIDKTSYRLSVLVKFDKPVSVSSCIYFRSGELLPLILKKATLREAKRSVSTHRDYNEWLLASINDSGAKRWDLESEDLDQEEDRIVYQSTITSYPNSGFNYGRISRRVVPGVKNESDESDDDRELKSERECDDEDSDKSEHDCDRELKSESECDKWGTTCDRCSDKSEHECGESEHKSEHKNECDSNSDNEDRLIVIDSDDEELVINRSESPELVINRSESPELVINRSESPELVINRSESPELVIIDSDEELVINRSESPERKLESSDDEELVYQVRLGTLNDSPDN